MSLARLYYFPGSPFARMARVLVHEWKLDVETIEIAFPPTDDLFDLNPLGQVPVLRLRDGQTLFPTLIVLEHLWQSAGSPIASYDPVAQRQLLLTILQAGDALVAAMYQNWTGLGPVRENTIGYDPAERHSHRFGRVLNWLENHEIEMELGFTLANVALSCILLWSDSRDGPDWRAHTQLASIVDELAALPAFQSTQPQVWQAS